MSYSLSRRLARLEQSAPALLAPVYGPVIVDGEPAADAIARQYPEGVPANAVMIIIRIVEPPPNHARH